MRTIVLALLVAAATATPVLAAESGGPPVARRDDVVENLFGKTVRDPYRWMEGEHNAEFQAWLAAQGNDARRKLDALPTLDAWMQALKASSTSAVIHRMQRVAGGRMFFILQTEKGSGTLMVRDADGRERVLLDPATLQAKGGSPSITIYSPSPDGRKVAVNVDHGGNEVTRVHVLDVTSGKASDVDAVEPVWGEFDVNWLPDGTGFTYTQMAPPNERTDGDPLQDMRLRMHRLGTPTSKDPVLLRAGKGPGANASFPVPSNRFPTVEFPAGSRWALGTASGAQNESAYCVAPRVEATQASAAWRCIATPDDKVVGAVLHGDTLYLISTREHSNGQVLALDLSDTHAGLRDAKPVTHLKDDEIIVGLTLSDAQTLAPARDALYLKVSVNGIDGVRRIDYGTGTMDAVTMPLAGTASLLRANDTQDGFLLELRGWTTPPKSWRYEPGTRTMTKLGQDEASPADYGMIEVTETDMVSKDGTRIPLTILHRKDAKLDGSHRAIVYGYGSYGFTLQPSFKPARMEWVKKGNVFAYAHVRGGGEKGEAWHVAGKGADKHKSVEDFVASVARLDELGYSRPKRTALVSGSAGGLLVGGAVTAYPETFGAAIFLAPVLNPVRLMHAPNGANQIGEMGDPRKAEDFPAILAMDPYQQIKPRSAFPAMLLMIGLNDSRVAPWQTGKFAAKARAENTSGKPIWIRTDANGGHGIQSSLGAEAAQWADAFAFLDAQLPAGSDGVQRNH